MRIQDSIRTFWLLFSIAVVLTPTSCVDRIPWSASLSGGLIVAESYVAPETGPVIEFQFSPIVHPGAAVAATFEYKLLSGSWEPLHVQSAQYGVVQGNRVTDLPNLEYGTLQWDTNGLATISQEVGVVIRATIEDPFSAATSTVESTPFSIDNRSIYVNTAPEFGTPSGPGTLSGADPAFTGTVQEGETLDFSLTATDQNVSDTLTITATVTGGTLSAVQAGFVTTFPHTAIGTSPSTLSMEGTAATAGSLELMIIVDDSNGGTDSLELTIVILANAEPILGVPTGPGDLTGADAVFDATIQVGGSLGFSVTATDSNPGDSLIMSAVVTGGSRSSAQAGFSTSFPHTATGVSPLTLSFGGTAADVGTIELTITVDDGHGGADSLVLTIHILTNPAPVIGTPTGPGALAGADPTFSATVEMGGSLDFTVSATDLILTDTLTFVATVTGGSLTAVQAGFVTVFPNSTIGGTPRTLSFAGTAANSGTIELSFAVDDGNGGSDSLTLSITINTPPSISSPTGPGGISGSAPVYSSFIQVGDSLAFTVQATDPDAGDSITFTATTITGTLTAAEAGFATIFPNTTSGAAPQLLTFAGTAAQGGLIEIFLQVTDASGATASVTLLIGISHFSSTLALASLDGNNGSRGNGVDQNEQSGWSVSGVGDVNGDGYDDFLSGAPLGGAGGSAYGETYLIFGAPSIGTGGSISLGGLDGNDGARIDGIDQDDNAGYSVSGAGDVNGDGYADFLIGAPFADGANNNHGEVYLIFGSPTIGSTGVMTIGSMSAAECIVIQGQHQEERAGNSVSGAGDVNGDGYDDIIIGAYESDPGGRDKAGRAYIIYGGVTIGSGGFLALSSLNGVNGVALNGIDSNDRAGRSVSGAADVNGDGYADVLVGAEEGDPNGNGQAGEVYLVYGGPSIGSGGVLELSTLDGSNGVKFNGIDSNDRAGWSVAGVGDANGDGYADFLIGAPEGDANGGNSGEAYLVYGAATLGAAGVFNLSTLSAATGVLLEGAIGNDKAGSSVSGAGDVNGDGFMDLLVGAYLAGPDDEDGETYLVFGGATIGVSGVLDLGSLSGSDGITIEGVDKDDWSGFSLSSAGDVNGDGLADLLIGAYGADPGGQSAAGETYVVYGCPTVITATILQFGPANDPHISAGGRCGDGASWSSPAARLWVDWHDGTAGTSSCMLTRTSGLAEGLPPTVSQGDLAAVMWNFTTTRTGFSTVDLILKYTDAEIEGLIEANLVVYQSVTESGPWTLVAGSTLDMARNRVMLTTSNTGYYILAAP